MAATGLELQATGFAILFARVGTVLMLLPIFSDDAVPGRIRVMIAVGMTIALWGLIGAPALAAAGKGDLPALLITELLTGLAMGMIVKIFFHAISMAGSMISVQIGLSTSVLFDPSQSGQVPLLSKYVTIAATLVCMGLHVHHLWLASIVQSYDCFPIGGLPPAEDFYRLALETVGRSMSLGIGLAAPVVIYGIVFNVALGLAARVAPAIQVFFIAQPLNILLGLALTATILGAVLTGFAQAMADWMRMCWGWN